MSTITYYDLSFAELFVFPKYLIAQVREDTVLQPKDNEELNKIAQKHFEGKNFIYISNRVFDYNVSPLIYYETSKISNLVGISIVTTSEIGKRTAQFESTFYSKEFFIASSIEDAINWSLLLLEQTDV